MIIQIKHKKQWLLSLSLPPLPSVPSITRARTHTLDREGTHTSHPTLACVGLSFIRIASVSSKWANSHFRTKAWNHLPLQIALILIVIFTIFNGISLAKLVRSHDCVDFVCKSQPLKYESYRRLNLNFSNNVLIWKLKSEVCLVS